MKRDIFMKIDGASENSEREREREQGEGTEQRVGCYCICGSPLSAPIFEAPGSAPPPLLSAMAGVMYILAISSWSRSPVNTGGETNFRVKKTILEVGGGLPTDPADYDGSLEDDGTMGTEGWASLDFQARARPAWRCATSVFDLGRLLP